MSWPCVDFGLVVSRNDGNSVVFMGKVFRLPPELGEIITNVELVGKPKKCTIMIKGQCGRQRRGRGLCQIHTSSI